jgi:hypothetical protein
VGLVTVDVTDGSGDTGGLVIARSTFVVETDWRMDFVDGCFNEMDSSCSLVYDLD